MSNRTPNDQDHTTNARLTLNRTRTFETCLENVRQLIDQMIFIYLRSFSYKYPRPFVYFVYFQPLELVLLY
jgi:hypothetical protein